MKMNDLISKRKDSKCVCYQKARGYNDIVIVGIYNTMMAFRRHAETSNHVSNLQRKCRMF